MLDYEEEARLFVSLWGRMMHRPVNYHIEKTYIGEGRILLYLCLKHNGATAGELKKELEVGASRIANALKNLEAKGLVTREISQEDKRQVLVYITEEGKEVLKERNDQLMTNTIQLLRQLGEEDTKEFLRLMEKVLTISEQNIFESNIS